MQPLPSDLVTTHPTAVAERPRGRVESRLIVGYAAVTGILVLAWAGPIARRMIRDGDFPFHLQSAVHFATTGRITVPHFLLQVALGRLYATGFFPTIDAAGLAFFYAVHVLTAVAVFWFIAGSSRHPASLTASVLLAVAVLMSGPYLPRSAEPGVFLIGYFPVNAYHNPTLIVSKPLLVLFFAAAMASLTRFDSPSGRELAAAAVASALLGLAKPNYLGCLVPALLLMAVWHLWRGRAFCWRRASVVVAASVVTLGASYTFYRSGRLGFDSGIVFAPFTVIGLYSPSDAGTLVRKLLASIVFPLVVVAMWPRASWRSASMRLAWASFAIGLFFSYFVAEAGPRLPDGNFLWSGQMAAFVLFVASAAFVRAQLTCGLSGPNLARAVVIALVMAMHVESGIRHVLVKVDPSRWAQWWQRLA